MVIEDVDELLDLVEVVAAERRWIGAEPPIDRSHWRRRHLDSAERESLVAVVDERIAGHVELKNMNGLVDIGMLVSPQRRGVGIGSALLQAAIDRARMRHAHKLTLQVWPHNEAAVRLYEKFGFVKEGYLKRHWKRSNGEVWDVVIMGLQL